jgi:RHS repeat-associated protein
VNKSIAAGTNPVNKYQFQGNEMQDLLGMQLYDFNARQYDPQIGRFTAIDLLADNFQESLSPYHFCGNNPANYVDPSGLILISHDILNRISVILDAFVFTDNADQGVHEIEDHTAPVGGGGGGGGGSLVGPPGWGHGGGGGGGGNGGGQSARGGSPGGNGNNQNYVGAKPVKPLKPKLTMKEWEQQRSQRMAELHPFTVDPKYAPFVPDVIGVTVSADFTFFGGGNYTVGFAMVGDKAVFFHTISPSLGTPSIGIGFGGFMGNWTGEGVPSAAGLFGTGYGYNAGFGPASFNYSSSYSPGFNNYGIGINFSSNLINPAGSVSYQPYSYTNGFTFP